MVRSMPNVCAKVPAGRPFRHSRRIITLSVYDAFLFRKLLFVRQIIAWGGFHACTAKNRIPLQGAGPQGGPDS